MTGIILFISRKAILVDGFTLPDGLAVNRLGPDWLKNLWPYNGLDSSLQSLMGTLAILVGLLAAALILSFIARGLPRVLNVLGPLVGLTLAAAIAASGFFTVQSWQSPNAISDTTMTQAATTTSKWLTAKGADADNRQVWDLLCDYYHHKNHYCDSKKKPEVRWKGEMRTVKLLKQSNGSYELVDTKNQVPLD